MTQDTTMNRSQSEAAFARAQEALVGGVNSPVRAFKAVGGTPFFAKSGQGAIITDADGNEYIDYVLSWGPLILGHAHPVVHEAVAKALERGASFGIPTEAEIQLGEMLVERVPALEQVRLVSSGTEATMSAIRLARGYTDRDIVVKVAGCYHGHVDSLLVSAGSGPTTFGTPTSPGIPTAHTDTTLTIPFNDLGAAAQCFAAHGDEIACLIIEPVPGNMGLILPEEGYLEGLHALTNEHKSLLIFDEVMCGFRCARGGAQEAFGITPDMVTLGKVIGGGLPVGAYGGRKEIMQHLSPVGPVYQAGTLSGNPLATAAGIATLDELSKPGMFETAEAAMRKLSDGLLDIAREAGVPAQGAQIGTMGCLFFRDEPVRSYADALDCDTDRYAKYFHGMLDRGVYFAPAQFEAGFTSIAHTDELIDRTLSAAREVFSGL